MIGVTARNVPPRCHRHRSFTPSLKSMSEVLDAANATAILGHGDAQLRAAARSGHAMVRSLRADARVYATIRTHHSIIRAHEQRRGAKRGPCVCHYSTYAMPARNACHCLIAITRDALRTTKSERPRVHALDIARNAVSKDLTKLPRATTKVVSTD